jgi:hypothetical protein
MFTDAVVTVYISGYNGRAGRAETRMDARFADFLWEFPSLRHAKDKGAFGVSGLGDLYVLSTTA